MSLYSEMRDFMENTPVPHAARTWGETDAIPTEVDGKMLRSRLEAGWALTLNRYGIRWDYEPKTERLPSGKGYVPDFWLPDLNTVIEAKGPHLHRLDKTREYARQNCPQLIVIIGYSPARRTLSPYRWESFMQWSDAAGGSALFAECTACGAKQWCRPRFSMACRQCGERFSGHLAMCGEMRFEDWKEENYPAPGWTWEALCPGFASMTSFPFTAR